MMKRNSSKSIRTIIWTFIFIACLVTAESFVSAKDLNEDFTLVSPEYVNQINYIHEEVPFKITAPKGWYMLLRKEDSLEPDRAIFCKNNPEEKLSKGSYTIPCIKISFFPNRDYLSAESYVEQLMPLLEKQNIPVLLQPKPIKIDNETGFHFITAHMAAPMVVDTFVFARRDIYILIEAYAFNNEIKETAGPIKEAIRSIKFSKY